MTVLPLVAEWASWVVVISAMMVSVRLIMGPGIADRAVALDMLGVLMVAFAGLRAIITGLDAYLDVAAVLALTSFLGTVALSRYIARRGREER